MNLNNLLGEQKVLSLNASQNLCLTVDRSIQGYEKYSLLFKNNGNSQDFRLGYFPSFKELDVLESDLKHQDYHLIYNSKKKEIIGEFKQSELFLERSKFYKNNGSSIELIDGLHKTIYRDDNDALLDVLYKTKEDLIKHFVKISLGLDENFYGAFKRESFEIDSLISQHNRDFYNESLFLFKELFLKRNDAGLFHIPFVESFHTKKLNCLLEKTISWETIRRESKNFIESLNDSSNHLNSSTNIREAYAFIHEESTKNAVKLKEHFKDVLEGYASASVISKQSRKAFDYSTKKLFN